MIMLEGPDLAGKTTTAKQLQKMMRGSRIVHRGPPESQDPFVEYLRPLEDAYYNDEWLILDRWHWGERIYGPLWRGGTIIDDVQLAYLEMACMRYGVSKLLFIPPLPALLRRFDARGDDLVQRDQMIHVADAYQHIAVSKQHNVHKLFEREEPFSRTDLAWIVSEAMGYRSRANLFAWWPSYVGPTRPEVLFIGEKPAESHLGEFKTAFVPYRGTSGYHLLKCLRAVEFDAKYGFVNAYEGCEDFKALWVSLERPEVVTLGRKAHEAIHRLDVTHGMAPHPQFARRFYNRAVESYGEALRRAVEGEDMNKWKG